MSEIGLQPMNAGGPMTDADWTARNPLLDRFQIGLVVDAATGMITKAKLGDGTHQWNDLEWWSPDGGISNTENTTSLPPASANDGTVLPAVQTYDAVGRIVLGQTSAKGTEDSYVRIRASAGGTILASATVIDGSTDLTHINQNNSAENYAIEIEAWLELVVTAATVPMLSSATINDIGADNVNNVFARFATPTSAAEAVTQRAYVFETDDSSLTFYEATPQTVYGAGTASCDGVATFYDIGGDSLPNFVFAGSISPSDDGVISSSGSWRIKRNSNIKYFITSNAASPSLATGTWTVNSPAVAPAPTVLGVTYDVEVASRVQWPIQSAVLLADFPKTNNTLTAVPDLTLNLEAGHWYRVDFTCSLLPDAGYADVDFAGGTVTATGVGGAYTSFDGNLLTFGGGVISILGVLVTNGDNSGELGWVSGSFVVQVNAGGTLILRFAQASTNAAAATLLKYSTIQAIDVTP